MTCDRLIIFARYPEFGKVKTRLIAKLGAAAATEIYRQLAELTIKTARNLRLRHKIDLEIWFTGGTAELMGQWLGQELLYREQVGASLGDRLIYALGATVNQNSKVLIIGTDCPNLTVEILEQGLINLQNHDLVLGSATDGGYYLIGMKQFLPQLFTNIAWSSAVVAAQTLEIAADLGLQTHLLPPLTDIDNPEDLKTWLPEFAISVIIPTLNEAQNLEQVLQSCLGEANVEVIVVDGGSRDQTTKIATAYGVRLIQGERSRAEQMNLGAKVARGRILVFLHGDTVLPEGYGQEVLRVLASGAIAGAFQLKIASQDWRLGLVAWGANRRSQIWQLPYGDQALFLERTTFEQLGGFPNLAIMEDFVMVRHLQTLGQITIARLAVSTSPRRWQNLGIVRTTLINQLMLLGYCAGISPTILSRWYRHWKG